jgi:hypothetical protein
VRDECAVLARTDVDLAVAEPPPELFAGGLGILLEPVVELRDLGLDLLDARKVQRLLHLCIERLDRLALLRGERFVIVQRLDDVARSIAGRDEVGEAGHLLFSSREPLLAIAQLGIDLLRVIAELRRCALPHLEHTIR